MAVIADDTTDVSNHLQNVVVFRYIVSGKVVGRFWTFCDLPQGNAENVSANVISCLNRGVQSIVREACPNAHYAHCYAHQLNPVLQQATSQIDSVRVFFAHLNPLSVFFSHSTKRVSCLDDCVQTRWNFDSRIVSTVFEHKDDLKECFNRIVNTWKRTKLVFMMQVASSLGLRTGTLYSI